MADEPHPSGEDRFAVYAVPPRSRTQRLTQRRLCETSRDGIGLALLSMLGLDPDGQPDPDSEAEIPRGWRFGVLDRATRLWIVNPYA